MYDWTHHKPLKLNPTQVCQLVSLESAETSPNSATNEVSTTV